MEEEGGAVEVSMEREGVLKVSWMGLEEEGKEDKEGRREREEGKEEGEEKGGIASEKGTEAEGVPLEGEGGVAEVGMEGDGVEGFMDVIEVRRRKKMRMMGLEEEEKDG